MEEPLLSEYLAKQIEWSKKTFGDTPRTIGITKHMMKEIEEVRQSPEDLSEWADLMILAFDGFWRHGGTPETIMKVLLEKQNKNLARTYPFPVSDNEPSEHDRTKE